jgi:hypothetical protein
MTTRWLSDLKLAAEFVKSIKTENNHINFELEEIARSIKEIADELTARENPPTRENEHGNSNLT